MENKNEKSSPTKENSEKKNGENEIREGSNNSIYKDDNDKSAYPYKNEADEQHKTQPEFIDRDSDSKDKS